MRRAFLLPLLIVQAFVPRGTTMPSADFCSTIRMDYSILSPDSGTCNRSPAIRLTAFNAQPPNLQPAPLMDMDFAVTCQLVRRRMPPIRFLSIGSRLCSTLPSDPASRRPCASLSLLLHQDVKGTYTPKLSIMHGVHAKRPLLRAAVANKNRFIGVSSRFIGLIGTLRRGNPIRHNPRNRRPRQTM
jgi:hypothetical protein